MLLHDFRGGQGQAQGRPDLSFKAQQQALAQAAAQTPLQENPGLQQTLQAAQSLMEQSSAQNTVKLPDGTAVPTSVMEKLLEANNGLLERIEGLREGMNALEQNNPGVQGLPATSGTPGTPDNSSGMSDTGNPLVNLLDKYEGGGRYDTLFAHSQRKGGAFEGVDITQMTINDVLRFADVNGKYGNWVKSELARQGQKPRIATPMGRGQIVGTTLKKAVAALGLDGNTLFDANTQNNIIDYLARQRIASSNTMAGRRAALRAEWEGFKSVPNSELDKVILQYMNA